ncbi:MAG: site-specific DNA-methyltransferase, partial [Treponema sp.]|nr:site-specific DNA-methyltransferase [Treponema sp.]
MIKDIINSNESKNIHDDDIQFLQEHFPSCFTKQTVDYSGNIIPSKFDIEKLRKIIDTKIDIIQEGYGLDFLGKTYARYISSLQSETVLVPDTKHNSKEENKTSKNIYISGDNIDALKHLLKSYEQSVKCIYIDPPYNTGSDNFVYKDNFNFSKDDLQKKLNLTSDEAERVLDLTNRGSSSHSAWLMFMYPRLLLARELLKDDGMIFISIDDNEQADLKLLCDDVFGEENFVAKFDWRKKTGA